MTHTILTHILLPTLRAEEKPGDFSFRSKYSPCPLNKASLMAQ